MNATALLIASRDLPRKPVARTKPVQQAGKRFSLHRNARIAQLTHQRLTFRAQHVQFRQMHQHRRQAAEIGARDGRQRMRAVALMRRVNAPVKFHSLAIQSVTAGAECLV